MSQKSCVLDWFSIQKEITTPIKQQTKVELNPCLQRLFVSERQTIGEPFKFSSLKAIRAAIDRFLNQADRLTSRSLSLVIMNLRQMIRPMQFAKI